MKNIYKMMGVLAVTAVLGSEMKAQTSYTWSPAGPVLSAGRSRNMVVDRTNSNNLYIGSVSSGVFTSANAGATWVPLNDQDTVRNISYMAQSVDGKVWAATGEGFLRATARGLEIPGTGLYQIVGSHLIQKQPASVTGSVITRIACHPTNASNMAIAGSNGLWLSIDGGNTFTQASGSGIVPTTTALTVAYDNSGAIYVTATNYSSGGGVRLYKSADGSAAGFVDITPLSSQLPDQNYGRIEIGIAGSNNAVIYASVAKPTNPMLDISSASIYAFFVSKDGGNTWILILQGSPQLDPLSDGNGNCSGDYAQVVVVNPFNPDQVLVGSYQCYSWSKTVGGPEGVGTWGKVGYEYLFDTPLYLHQNIHDIKAVTSGNNLSAFYFVTEAGVYKSSDFLNTFQPFFSGLGTAQYNNIAIPRYPKARNQNNSLTPYTDFIASTAGNGVSYFSGNYPLVSNELNYLSGDFFSAEYSKISPKTAFFAAANSNIYVASDITSNAPNQILVSHLGSQCNSNAPIATIDYRGITESGSTTDEIYSNNNYNSTGTPFKIWENYGTIAPIDSAIFFNDSIPVLISLSNSLTTTFSLSLIKPQHDAIIDKITIRTFTVPLISTSSSTCFIYSAKSYTANQKGTIEFGGASSSTAMPTGYTLTGLTSTVINANNNYSIDPVNLIDMIQFGLPTNPLLGMNNVVVAADTINWQFVKVGVTVFYRYNAGANIHVNNGNISIFPFKDSTTLGAPMQWSFNNVGTNSLSPISTAAPIKYKMPINSRFAILNNTSILVSKRILNTNDPQKFQVVSCTGALTTNSSTFTAGQMTVNGSPYILEWAPNGKALYYVTSYSTLASPTPTYYVYKVNVGTSIYDFAIDDYRGDYYTGCVNGTRTSVNSFTYATNFNSKFRTTLLGTFSVNITNLAVSDNNKTLLLTTSDLSSPNQKRIYVSSSPVDVDNIDNTIVTFNDLTGNLPAYKVNCALFEMKDNRRVLVGTDRGIYATDDITAATPVWFDAKNGTLPNVRITSLKQQKMSSWDSYNSGMIYVATNGRGAWINSNFFTQTEIGIPTHEIIARNTGVSLYPNPTNGNVTLNFFASENENVVVNIMDLNGRVIKSEVMGRLNSGYTDYNFSASELSNGVYIVNVTSSLGIKRVTKLIVSK